MFTLFRREISNFLNNLTGYIVIGVFLIIMGLFLWVFPVEYNILLGGYAHLEGLFSLGPLVFLFLVPAITMRFFADEKKTGTIELLLTRPVTETGIILAKFFAGLVLVILALIPTLVFFLSVHYLALPAGNIDHGGIWGSYIGLLLLGAGFVSIGLFASSLTDNQVVAFLIALFLCGFSYLGFEMIYSLEWFGSLNLFIRDLGIHSHYLSLSRGVIDSRNLIYFFSLIVIFLLLTKIKLESRKW
ncbi:MAG: gliding motility-associated ABC transporter permease subunit GldF [Bacteroidales bacterium]